MNSQIDAQSISLPKSDLLSEMQGQTITDGWDVICAMDAEKINTLFAQQYVLQVEKQPTFFTVTDSTYIIDSQSSAQFINLVLGPPLISFNAATNDMSLQINFVSGTVNLLDAKNTIISSQSISIGDQFQLSGNVPFSTLVGEVNNYQVVLDISNADKFSASLNISAGSETTLGEHFLDFLKSIINSNDPNSFNFVLGTLTSDASSNLTPVSFDLSTQNSGNGDSGRLLLLIQTTCSSTPGLPNWNPSNFTNIIPDGYSTALIVSSKVLFSNLLVAGISQQYAQNNQTVPTFTPNQTASSRAYSLTIATASNDLGKKSYSDGWNGTYYSVNDITIPGANAQLSCNSQYTLQLDLQQQWTDDWYHDYTLIVAGNPVAYHVPVDVTTTASVHTPFSPTVNSSTCIVSFTPENQPAHGVSIVDQDGDSDASLYNQYYPEIGTAISNNFTPFTQIQPPDINTFAVSNLLFPGDHILNFEDVYIPGDLVIFGDIYTKNLTTSPVSAIVAAGPDQTYQFSASQNGQSAAVNWSLKGQNGAAPRGTINGAGLYTAPNNVSKTEWVQVTATTLDNQSSSHSILFLVPAGVLLSPDVVVLGDSATQQFTASVDGKSSQSVEWSFSPNVGGWDTSNNSEPGNYQAPAAPATQVKAPTAVTITAQVEQENVTLSGSALAVVTSGLETGVMVASPASATLEASQTHQFTLSVAAPATWSVLAASNISDPGSVDATGIYTAPSTITHPQVVVVAATAYDGFSNKYALATAVVYLEPPTAN